MQVHPNTPTLNENPFFRLNAGRHTRNTLGVFFPSGRVSLGALSDEDLLALWGEITLDYEAAREGDQRDSLLAAINAEIDRRKVGGQPPAPLETSMSPSPVETPPTAGRCALYGTRGHNPRACVTCRIAEEATALEAARRLEVQRAEEFAQAVSGELSPDDEAALTGRFKLWSADDVRTRPNSPDIVDGLIGPKGTLNQINGHRGSMKSLVTLGLAAAIGGGMDSVYGLPVRTHGPVLYVYLEGVPGLTRRLQAWEDHHGRRMTGVTFLHDPIDLKHPDDVRALSVIARRMKASVIILDSVAKSGGGREDIEDFGAYRQGLEALKDTADAAVLTLHNSGHDKTRGRGHTVLIDGMDSAVTLVRKPDREGGGVALVDEKSRDSAAVAGTRLQFLPCGPKRADGSSWSGVAVVQDVMESANTAVATLTAERDLILKAIDTAETPGEASSAELAAALGVTRSNLSRSLRPFLEANAIRTNGKGSKALKYLRGEDQS